MARKEEIAKESSIFSEREAHGHHYRDLMCGFEAGAQWADETMIEKACEWMEKNARNARDYVWHDEAMCGAGVTDKFINDFKQAMMEE